MDKREMILVRLEAILTELAGSSGIFVYRNRAEFDDTELPAYVLLDGTENNMMQNKRAGTSPPTIMLLQSQLFYVPKPTENQLNVNVGPDLSAKRSAMLAAVVRDGVLQDLLGSNGYIEYRGMETDMQTGGEVKGQFRLDFAFAYVLDFNKL